MGQRTELCRLARNFSAPFLQVEHQRSLTSLPLPRIPRIPRHAPRQFSSLNPATVVRGLMVAIVNGRWKRKWNSARRHANAPPHTTRTPTSERSWVLFSGPEVRRRRRAKTQCFGECYTEAPEQMHACSESFCVPFTGPPLRKRRKSVACVSPSASWGSLPPDSLLVQMGVAWDA